MPSELTFKASLPEARASSTARDPRLAPFLDASDPSSEQDALCALMSEHVQPLVRRILRGKVRPPAEADDLASRAVVLLLSRLHRLKSGGENAIHDFDGYVAATTYRVYHDYLREKHPAQHRIKTSLRYLLKREPRFALWQEPAGTWLCGRVEWRESGRPSSRPDLLDSAGRELTLHLPSWERRHVVSALASIFESVGSPMPFDAVVRVLVDRTAHLFAETAGDGAHVLLGNPARQVDDLILLKELWSEIVQLPIAMRTVLLLNLRGQNGRDVIGLLPSTGVASLRDLAQALEMPVEELAALWMELPLDDQALAARLGLTRPQVANLRASARRRLSRQMGQVT
jgi:DNA-directed RNA polymerase specialized sigma24 family protein